MTGDSLSAGSTGLPSRAPGGNRVRRMSTGVTTRLSRLLPERGPQRTMTVATLLNTVGNGVYLTTGVLYFVRKVGLPATQVGLGLSIAGAVTLLAGIPGGHLADRLSPRGVYSATLLARGVAVLGMCFVWNFWSFIVAVAVSGVAQNAGNAAKGPIIRQHGGDRPQRFRAYLRSVTNIGVALGAMAAGWAIQLDSSAAYLSLFAGSAVSFAVCAVIVRGMPRTEVVPAAGGTRWGVLRDRPFMALTVLDGVLAIQLQILTFAVPLWLVTYAFGQRWLISVTVVVNTVVVVFFQVWASSRVDTPEAGGRALRRAGFAFLLSCVLISCTVGLPGWLMAAVLLAGIVVHTFGEMWQAAGEFELSFGLAPPHAQGQYLGLFGMGAGLSQSISPALLTILCIGLGKPGWYLLGGLLAATGLAAPLVVRWAAATRDEHFGTPDRQLDD